MKTITLLLLILLYSNTIKSQAASGKLIPIATYINCTRDTTYELKLYGRGPSGKFKYQKIVPNFVFYYIRFGTYTIKDKMLYLKFRNSRIEMGPFEYDNFTLTDVENENHTLHSMN